MSEKEQTQAVKAAFGDPLSGSPLPIDQQWVPLVEVSQRIHPRSVRGRFNGLRWAAVALTQCVYFGLPWLQWNERQAVRFDLETLRFYLFGLVLYPQDLIYLAVLLILCALGLFLVTTVAGRVWCGFSCPQTVYTTLFTRIEHWMEGERSARIRLDAASWNTDKVLRKLGTQTSWVALSWWTGLTLVGYFTPIRALVPLAVTGAAGPWETFWILFYGVATYVNAGYLRESICKHMCPYGRFQGVMFDRDTLIIGYDVQRGEPRGALRKDALPALTGLGDCIDCRLCVQVCPTGIDIREGLQSNCIGCAACIDACDGVMHKLQRPAGLIRYASLNGFANGWSTQVMVKRLARPRVLVYTALLAAVFMVFAMALHLRPALKLDVMRDRTVQSRIVEGGASENLYSLHVMNALEEVQTVQLDVIGPPGIAVVDQGPLRLQPTEARTFKVAVHLPATPSAQLAGRIVPIEFAIRSAGHSDERERVKERSTFLVP